MEKPLIDQKIDEAPWTTKQTFNGLLLTLAPWILLAIGLSSLNGTTTRSRHLSVGVDLTNAIILLVFSALIESAFLIAPFYYASKAFRTITPRLRLAFQALGFRTFRVGQALFWIILLLPVILGADSLYQNLIDTFHLHLQTNTQVLFEQSKNAPLTTYSTLFAAVIIAPFCEEIFFRGFVFAGLRRGMPLGWAIVFSALIFAVAHADIGSFAVLFIIGLALAFLRWRTRSIWPGMLLHMLNNGLAALTLILAMQGVVRQ